MAPIVRAIAEDPDLEGRVLVTAQHRELLDAVLEHFEIQPDADLNLMEERQTLHGLTARALTGVAEVLRAWKPDFALVHGDTVTTVAASLAAFFERVPCGHVEAGLRSGRAWDPFPEEMDRRLADTIADIHLAPTPRARDHLRREGVEEERIYVTGNSAIDAFLYTVERVRPPRRPEAEVLHRGRRVLAVETHRRENWDGAIAEIARAVGDVVDAHPDVEVIYSVHPNPVVKEAVHAALAGRPRVHLCEPFTYPEWVYVVAHSYLVLSDSGGIQEEAPAIGKPLIVARRTTERPEAVEAGTAWLAGTGYEEIRHALETLLNDRERYQRMSRARNPFGDGRAAERTVAAVKHRLGLGPRPEPFRPEAGGAAGGTGA
ncbi:MAG: UDP-N-acetylglucosamine 2-epimerase (non-hydrolyzing) [Firmicutes bacterium]|nr:UDP-N-acetylglucosamine 2-epimerase (non-hydrolyzing) [Bacillota bacterium]